jgi:uncharacterized protein (TIGR02466 family)
VSQLLNGGIHPFTPYIWKYSYEFNLPSFEDKLNALFDMVDRNSELESDGGISTVAVDQNLQPHTWPEMRNFQLWLGDRIEQIRRDNNFFLPYSEVTQSWCNRHFKGGKTLEHNHNFSTFVAACYIKCPPNSGNIEFKDPLEYHKTSWPIIPELSLYKEIPVTTNDVIIFPGWLRHRVQPSQTDQERVVLTFNIK